MSVYQIPIVHSAEVLRRRCRVAATASYRTTGFVEFTEIRSSDAEVAYVLKLLGGDSIHILEYAGRLLWPAKYTSPFRTRVEGDALQELLDGRLDLFSDQQLASSRPLEDDLSVRKINSDGIEAATVNLHRKASSCVLVDGELFIEGGAPIEFASMSQLLTIHWISSPGADRSLQPRVDGLALQPSGAHLHDVHWAIAFGSFWLPKKEAQPRQTGYPIIVARREHELDPVDIRVDAMCRFFSEDFKKRPARPNDKDGLAMQALLDDVRPTDQPDLTAVRCEALHGILAMFPERLTPRARRTLREVLVFAAKAGRTATPEEFHARQATIEDEAITALA